jgi:hypothetical protein
MNTKDLHDEHFHNQGEQTGVLARLHVLSGLHAGAALTLTAPSSSLGPDLADDMVLLDADGGRLTFDYDPQQGWCVTPESGVLTIGGSEVPLYEQALVTTPRCALGINSIQLEFVCTEERANVGKANDQEGRAHISAPAPSTISLEQRHPMRMYAGVALCAAALVLLAFTLVRGEDNTASAQNSLNARTAAALTSPKMQGAEQNISARQQVADYLNAFRWPISILGVSDMKIDLAWSGADALPVQVMRQIGPVLFGRMVEWSDTTEPVNVADVSIAASARERRLNPNRGNRHTEDTLRGYGLTDIASVSAIDANPRFVLTRAGHRIYEGSELKNGAKLAAVSATELMVHANGSTWLVPYDVSKPVRRVANTFTTLTSVSPQEGTFPQASSASEAQTVNANVAGTPIAVVSMPRGKSTESGFASQSR